MRCEKPDFSQDDSPHIQGERIVKFVWVKGLMRAISYTAYFTTSQSWEDYRNIQVKPGRVVEMQFCECGHVI